MNYFITQILPIIVLVTLSGLFSGLTLGLMSLDPFELQRKVKLGDNLAMRVYPVRKKGNELLTALLLGNAAINSALSIFLTSVTSGVMAGILATVLIFVFGEVLPQAWISRFALKFGSKMIPVVKILMFITYPITKPFGYLLNKVLGKELPTIYSKQELAQIISEHEDSGDGIIDADEERIIIHALNFSEKKAASIMTPRTVVFAVEKGSHISNELISKIKQEGYSRVPVYENSIDNIVGILNAKDLLGIKDGLVAEYMHGFISTNEDTKLDNLKNILLQSHQHMAIIQDQFGGFAGVVTLEDILEEVIGREIMDEGDTDADMQEVARKKAVK